MTTANGEVHGLQDLIADQCRQHEEIITAYVFGSRVKGGAKPGSDTDIAVLLDENRKHSFDYLECKVSLERKLNTEVDLIVLNDAGELFKHQIRRDGVRVFDRDPYKRKQWERMSRKFYQDYLHLHSIYMKRLHKSLRST